MLIIGIAGCQIVGGYETFEAPATPSEAKQPHACDTLTTTSKADAKNLGALVLVKPPQEPCFWIDRYEVSVEQYRRFLSERPAKPFVDQVRCSWKTSPSDPERQPDDECTKQILDAGESEPFKSTKPIRCVDWCDAVEFCRWSGKDLCASGRSFLEPGDFTYDQWGKACSPSGDPYPYGLSAKKNLCNVGLDPVDCKQGTLREPCSPVPPEVFPACTSESGAKDMLGNVAEWTMGCSRAPNGGPDPSPDAVCQHRGGSFDDDLLSKACSPGIGFFSQLPRGRRDRHVGIRCCAALSAEELAQVR